MTAGDGAASVGRRREAAAHVADAVDRYAGGDLAGAAGALRDALRLDPEHGRAASYLAWVESLLSGARSLSGPRAALDEDVLQAVSSALTDEPPPLSPPRLVVADSPLEGALQAAAAAQAAGVPLTAPAKPAQKVTATSFMPALRDLGGLDWSAAPDAAEPPVEAPAVAPSISDTAPVETNPAPFTQAIADEAAAEPSALGPPPGTLMGLSPLDVPALTPAPVGRKKPPSSDELEPLAPVEPITAPLALLATPAGAGTAPRLPALQAEDPELEMMASVTRRWTVPTGRGLPILDVPELTEEQIRELLALDDAPTGVMPDAALDDAPTGVIAGAVVEMEAEPEPFDEDEETRARPDLSEDGPTIARGEGPRLDGPALDADAGGEDDAVDQAYAAYEDEQTSRFTDFDETQLTPTRDRQRVLRDVAGAVEPGALPAMMRKAGYDTSQVAVLEPIVPLEEAIERSDAEAALQAAEEFVAESGGIDAEQTRARQWLLERAYELTAGPPEAVPVHARALSDLDPRSAFVLSRVDGMTSIEDLLEVSGMPRLETLRVLALLIQRGALSVA